MLKTLDLSKLPKPQFAELMSYIHSNWKTMNFQDKQQLLYFLSDQFHSYLEQPELVGVLVKDLMADIPPRVDPFHLMNVSTAFASLRVSDQGARTKLEQYILAN